MDQAVAIALQRNRDVIAARLEIEAAQLDRWRPGIYPNPVLPYCVGNLVLGAGNPQRTERRARRPGFFSQPVQTVGVSEIIDVWAKRSARIRAADRGRRAPPPSGRGRAARDRLRRALRRSPTSCASSPSGELGPRHADRYAETIRLSRARFTAGDISEAELRKIELEGLRYQNDVIDADMELDVARQKLAALLGLASAPTLPARSSAQIRAPAPPLSVAAPDRAGARAPPRPAGGRARRARWPRRSSARPSARRSPTSRSAPPTRTASFTVSGDNPNTLALGAVAAAAALRSQPGEHRPRASSTSGAPTTKRRALALVGSPARSPKPARRARAGRRALLALFEGGRHARRAPRPRCASPRSRTRRARSRCSSCSRRSAPTSRRARSTCARCTTSGKRAIDVSHAVGERP